MEYKRDEHRVHLIVYHLIWCPKRRRPVLKEAIAADFEAITREVCDTQGWEILELAVQPDHVHLFVRVWPKDSAADVVGKIKGRTSHDLRKKYPQLLKLPSLWSSSFFASTAGSVSAETIKRYIEAQKGV
jgi:putative transposase